MNCSGCNKTYDFMKGMRVQHCDCFYCTKCIVKKLYELIYLTNTLIKGSINCCDATDAFILFSIGSVIHNEWLEHKRML